MKRILVLFLLAVPAFGQTNIRWDWQANTVTGTGQMLPVLALPGAFINFYTNCTSLPCTQPAVTYRSPTGSLTCPANTQVVWQPATLTGCHATADSEGNFGGWFQAGAYQYVITVSGHQTGPYNFQVGGGGGGGSGTVTIVSCTDPDPIYGCTVANPTTAPAISFPLKNQAANTIFGNFTGSSGPPFFALFTCTGLLTCAYNSGTNTWNVDIPSTSTLNILTTDPIKVNGANGPVSSGDATISCPTCGTGGLRMDPTGLPAGQHVLLHATNHTITANSGACVTPVADNTSGTLALTAQTGGFPPSTCTVHWTFAGALAAQYPFISSGSVTAVYAYVISSWDKAVGSASLSSNAANMTPSGLSGFGWPLQSTNAVASWTGATLDTAYMDATLSRSGTTSGILSTLTVDNIGLAVYYTGAAPSSSTAFNVLPPLSLNPLAMTLGLDPSFPAWLIPQPISQLPAPAANFNQIQAVNNGISATDCTAGGGSFTVLCQTYSGNAWTAISGTGTSTTYTTETVSCTSTCTLAHTPVTFDNLSVNGLVMINGTDFTQSGTTITLTTPAVGGDVYYAQYHR